MMTLFFTSTLSLSLSLYASKIHLFLSAAAAAAFFTSVALNTAKFCISFGSIKPGGPLRWKKQLVKNLRLLRQLIQVMKIVGLTSLLLDMPRPSSLRLRHDS